MLHSHGRFDSLYRNQQTEDEKAASERQCARTNAARRTSAGPVGGSASRGIVLLRLRLRRIIEWRARRFVSRGEVFRQARAQRGDRLVGIGGLQLFAGE